MEEYKRLYIFGGEKKIVFLITKYQNGYSWIQFPNGKTSVVSSDYITKF